MVKTGIFPTTKSESIRKFWDEALARLEAFVENEQESEAKDKPSPQPDDLPPPHWSKKRP
jgi:hypothetical protein